MTHLMILKSLARPLLLVKGVYGQGLRVVTYKCIEAQGVQQSRHAVKRRCLSLVVSQNALVCSSEEIIDIMLQWHAVHTPAT